MGEPIDQSSFASILAGVQKMRRAYDVGVPAPAEPPRPAPTDEAPGLGRPSPRLEKPAQSPENTAQGPENTARDTAQDTAQKPQAPSQKPPATAPKTAPQSAPKTAPQSAAHAAPLHASRRAGPTNVHSYTQVQVAPSQKGNPLLESPPMKLTPWAFNAQILLDYYINATVQVLFLSLKYHRLRPEYVWRRLERLRGGHASSSPAHDQALRVLLVVVDIDSPQEALRRLAVVCVKNDLSMVVAWLFEEAGAYVAALKLNEMARTKTASSIQGSRKADYNSSVVATLTAVRAVNKTDVVNLLANCKSFRNTVLQAALGDGVLDIPGLGGRKAANLSAAFAGPFVFNKDWS